MPANKLVLAAAAAAALAARPAGADSIFDTAANSPNFTTLADLLELADLDGVLSGDPGEGTFTVFAPTDAAFEALPEELVTRLTDSDWKPQLQDVLFYHVLDSEVRAVDLVDGESVTAVNGEDIAVDLEPPRLNDAANILVDDGLVDIEADNGVIHGIDAVLAPASLNSTIVDIVAGDDRFSTLVAAVDSAGLVDALSGEGPLTLFAPTNDAFDAIEDPGDVDALIDLLQYHVVAANAASSALSDGDVETLNGDTVEVAVSDEGAVMVNDANVIEADIIASNGIVHVIDAVLVPPMSILDVVSNSEDPDFSALVDLLDLAGLADVLSGDEGTITLFAPTSQAFDTLPSEVLVRLTDPVFLPQLQDVLAYHVLDSVVRAEDLVDGDTIAAFNGEDIAVNLDPPRLNDEANILVDDFVDVVADNGVVHGIDAVLAPASLASNIVDIAAGDDRFSTLVAAVTAAGLGDALMGEGPLTVFAPTNEAFDDLPNGVLDDLLKPENKDDLVDVLLYHVVEANDVSSSLESGDLETLNGDSVEVAVSGTDRRRLQTVTVNDANVVDADIVASNGILHAIDAVLLPTDDDTPMPTPSPTKRRNKPQCRSGRSKSIQTKSSKSKSSKSKSSKSKSSKSSESKSSKSKTSKSSTSKTSKSDRHYRNYIRSSGCSEGSKKKKKDKKSEGSGKEKKGKEDKKSEGSEKEKKDKKGKEDKKSEGSEKEKKDKKSEGGKKEKKDKKKKNKKKNKKDMKRYRYHNRNRRPLGPLFGL